MVCATYQRNDRWSDDGKTDAAVMESSYERLPITGHVFLLPSFPSAITGTGHLLLQHQNYLRSGRGREGREGREREGRGGGRERGRREGGKETEGEGGRKRGREK